MTDTASLKIEVNTAEVERATAALDALTESATKAGIALARLGRSTGAMGHEIQFHVEPFVLGVIDKHMRPGGRLNPGV